MNPPKPFTGEQFRALLDSAEVLLFAVDTDSRILFANRAWKTLLGWEPEAIIGRRLPDFAITVDSKRKFAAAFPSLLDEKHGSLTGLEREFLTADGAVVPMVGEANTVFAQGAPVGTFAVFRDVRAERTAVDLRREFFDSSEDLHAVAGIDGYFKELSVGWEKALGWTLEELKARPYISFVHPDDVPATDGTVEATLAGNDREVFENRYRHKDGSYRILQWSGRIDAARGLMYGTARDITELRAAEERQTRLLAAQAEASPDGILVVDAADRIVSTNSKFAAMWDLSEEVLRAGSDERAVAAVLDRIVDPDSFAAKIKHLYAHPAESSRDEIQLKDGRLFERFSAPFDLGDPGGMGRIWFFRDITEARRAEAQRERFFGSSIDLHAIADFRGYFTDLSPAWTGVFGYSLDELKAKPFLEFVHPDDRERTVAATSSLAEGHEVTRFENRYRCKDGSFRILQWESNSDTAAGVIYASARDITGLREAEAAALAAAKAKDRFLANMSHEIRTPLNGILGMAQLLDGSELTREQRAEVAAIRRSGEALLSIINEVLDLSKLEAGKSAVRDEEFDPRELVDDVLETASSGTRGKPIELVGIYAAEVPDRLRGDFGRLRQILLNLVGNAIKFTERGTVDVRVDLVEHLTRAVRLRFRVRDTGPGFDPARAGELFEPFAQADDSSARRHGGAGLGLSLVKRFAELLGGSVRADSIPGVGSEFEIEIPFACDDCVGGAARAPEAMRELSVLVVDDHPGAREAVLRRLEHCALRGEAVETAGEALARLDGAQAPDVVIVDSELPDGGAARLAAAAARRPEGKRPVVVLLTPRNAARLDAALPEGASARVFKPCRPATMLAALGGASHACQPQGPLEVEEPAPGAGAAALPGAPAVLIAEDDATNRSVARGFVERLGFAAFAVAGGEEALSELQRREYAMVLMDCQMPGMDGFTATRELRRREGKTRHTPVIALTAGVYAEDRARAIEAGMDDFLAKPVTLDALRAALERWGGPLDPAVLRELRETPSEEEATLLHEAGRAFLVSAEVALAELTAAAPERRSRLLHKLAGSARTIGAAAFARDCEELEGRGRASEIAAEEFARLRAVYGRVRAALERELS